MFDEFWHRLQNAFRGGGCLSSALERGGSGPVTGVHQGVGFRALLQPAINGFLRVFWLLVAIAVGLEFYFTRRLANDGLSSSDTALVLLIACIFLALPLAQLLLVYSYMHEWVMLQGRGIVPQQGRTPARPVVFAVLVLMLTVALATGAAGVVFSGNFWSGAGTRNFWVPSVLLLLKCHLAETLCLGIALLIDNKLRRRYMCAFWCVFLWAHLKYLLIALILAHGSVQEALVYDPGEILRLLAAWLLSPVFLFAVIFLGYLTVQRHYKKRTLGRLPPVLPRLRRLKASLAFAICAFTSVILIHRALANMDVFQRLNFGRAKEGFTSSGGTGPWRGRIEYDYEGTRYSVQLDETGGTLESLASRINSQGGRAVARVEVGGDATREDMLVLSGQNPGLLVTALDTDIPGLRVETLEPHPLHSFFVLGCSWVFSFPFIIGFSILIGILIVQEPRQIQNLLERFGSGTSSKLRVFWAMAIEVVAMSSATVIATIRAHPLQVGIGALLNIGFSLAPALYTEPSLSHRILWAGDIPGPIVLWNLWVVSAISWATPFMNSIMGLHGVLLDSVSARLSKSVSKAEGHIVIAGFGDLGRRLTGKLYRMGIVTVDRYRGSLDMFLPTGERIVVLEGVLCLDKDEEVFDLLVDSSIGRVGVVKIASDEDSTPIAIMGLCADVNSAQSLVETRVQFANHYLCLARDSQASFTSMDYLRRNKGPVRAVLNVGSGAGLAYFAHRSASNAMTQLYPAQIRAISLGEAAVAAIPGDGSPVIILGSGRETLFAIDAVLKSRVQAERVYVITLEPSMGDNGEVPITERRFAPVLSWRRGVLALPFWRTDWEGPGAATDHQSTVELNLLRADPRDEAIIEKVMAASPAAVVVSEPDIHAQLECVKAVLRGARLALSRDARYAVPRLIVGAETGTVERALNIGDAYLNYESIAQEAYFGVCLGHELLEPYPRQFGAARWNARAISFGGADENTLVGDLLVDALEDPAQRLCAIVASHSEITPFEAAFCVDARPGALAESLRLAAGLEWAPPIAEWETKAQDVGVPGLSGSRMYLDAQRRFVIKGAAKLHRTSRPVGRSPIKRGVWFELGSTDGKVENALGALRNQEPKLEWLVEQCPEMTTCTVAAYMKTVANQRAACGEQPRNVFARADEVRASLESLSSRARIIAILGQGASPGLLAHFLSGLVFRQIKAESEARSVINLTYVADQSCHNERFSVVNLYGFISKEAVKDHYRLEAMILRPVGAHTDEATWWESYLLALKSFMSEVSGLRTRLEVIRVPRDGGATAVLYCLTPWTPGPGVISNIREKSKCCRTCEGLRRCDVCREVIAATGGRSRDTWEVSEV